MKQIVYIFIGVLGALFITFLFYMIFIIKAGPVDISKENSVEISGIVEKVYEGGTKDLVFKFVGDNVSYYINRGLENKFELDLVKEELEGKKVSIWYAKHRSQPLGGGHMTQLQFKDSIYYTEWTMPLVSK